MTNQTSLFVNATPRSGFPVVAGLPWRTDMSAAQISAHELLGSQEDPLRAVTDWLRSLDDAELDYVIDRSTERNSHYKWCLGGTRNHYLIWMHQYKPPHVFERANRWARAVHNHRYSFSSRLLSGALHVSRYAVDGKGSLLPAGDYTQYTGSVTTMLPDEVHRINRVDSETLSLVIQGPAIRHSSTIFNLSSGAREEADDLDREMGHLIAKLSPR